jgi:hypothetical protein
MIARGQQDRGRRVRIALALYIVTTIVYFACASREVLSQHTPFNHYALLADSWIEGRLDLGGPPPAYAGNNDFARYQGKWYVTFPPFPAALLVPLLLLGGSPENVQDGQFFIWLAGIGPAVLFLVLEKLRRMRFATTSVKTNAALALLFAFGSVYFFTAEQGTVWYSAHVVGVALAALYLLFSLDAERPLLAGAMLGLAFLTRAPMLFAFPLFAIEAWRRALRKAPEVSKDEAREPEQLELPLARDKAAEQLELALGLEPERVTSADSKPVHWISETWHRLDGRHFFKNLTVFALPVAVAVVVSLWHNAARFDDPFDSGYGHLVIAWRDRITKWGLFHYHFLPRNLGVILTSLPWLSEPSAQVPFKINAHGLALWVTTPMYLWLLWPRRFSILHGALWASVAFVAIPTLFYQNTGWVQFGYRFSNDYSVFLFALLAIGGYRFGTLFRIAALWAVIVNAFGAWTFGRPAYSVFYFYDNTQRIIYQPD